MTAARPLILDTNIVLDAFVFADEAARTVRAALEAKARAWLATAAMREELARVLAYPKLLPRLAFHGLAAQDVLAQFDRHAVLVEPPARAPLRCADPDDQKFIDLAVAHGGTLLSKDAAVLALARRLAAHGVDAQRALVA